MSADQALPPCGPVAVLDVGKTHVKLSLLGEDGTLLSQVRRANRVLPGPPYPHCDVEGIWRWLLEQLARLSRRRPIASIICATHGATLALLGDSGLALPVLDYEYEGPQALAAEYEALRDGFGDTFSPALPAGLNAGRQLHWQARQFPRAFAAVRTIVAYPQYWAWRLSGVAAGEVSSWGCHSDLWDARRGRLSCLVTRMGWEALMAPLRGAGDCLGPLRPELARQTGLPAQCRVLCGLHDSNASLVRHLHGGPAAPARMSIVSSGTWAVVAEIGAPLSVLEPACDMLANIDVWGRPVPCMRFMGGREFAVLSGGQARDCGPEDIAALVARHTLALPAFAPCGGAWSGRQGRILGPAIASPAQAHALATLYIALVTDGCLTRLGSCGDIVIEGAFTANAQYAAVLAALRPGQGVWVSDDRSGTTAGAYLLAHGAGACPGGRQRVPALPIKGLAVYAQRWRLGCAAAGRTS